MMGPDPQSAAASPASKPGRAAALMPTRDCDVCIVGDDAAGLLLACDLAARGQEVVLFPTPGETRVLGLDAALAPGFGLSALDLIARVGQPDAAEIYALSVNAVRRGLLIAQEAGLSLGPKGRMAVARAHEAGRMAAEHAARETLVSDSSVLLEAEDLHALLGTPAFVSGLGLVPAHRLDAAAFRDALAAAAGEGELTIMPRPTALAADVHGLRKYVTTPQLKVRAFQVVFSGSEALARLAPELSPSLVPTPWVSGRFHVSGADVAYAGVVEEVGGTGLRWHWDKDRLAIAAETATRVRSRSGAARVLRRHGVAVAAGIRDALAESSHGVTLAPTRRRMPLIQEGEKGVWYCVTLGGDELGHGILGADLIGRAILDRDDSIRLFSAFGLEPAGTKPVSRLSAIAGYWRRHVADELPAGASPAGPAGEGPQADAGAAPPPRGLGAVAAAFRGAVRAVARLAGGTGGQPPGP
ncbi:FAD-binding oxidoreductase/lyase [Xanthobacter variabilis]|uniref:hypothetical protein n=1 Tax=Xanthobacter variabilis TaxID=3119932 RepID=UPI00374E6C02